MNPSYHRGMPVLLAVLFVVFTVGMGNSFAQPASSALATNTVRIVVLQGSVKILPAGRIRIRTRGAVAGVEVAEFVLSVDDADTTTLSIVDVAEGTSARPANKG